MNTTKKVTTGFTALAGLSLIAAGLAFSQPVQAQTPPTVPAPPMTRPHHGERHPEIRRALRNLTQAQNNLQHAAHDFGGHREAALDLVQKAIDQCQQALQDDRH